MHKIYYSKVRQRADGSIFIYKNYYIKEFLGLTAAMLLLAFVFAAIVMFALVYPPNTNAQSSKKSLLTIAPSKTADDEAAIKSADVLASDVAWLVPVSGRSTSDYGFRRNPFGRSTSEFHQGQDFAAPSGTPVIASADGEIVFAGWQRGYGNIVVINHANGISTRYAHLSSVSVKLKEPVRQGAKIGEVGATGRATAAHLHYEVRVNDKSVDPLIYLSKSKIVK